MIISTIAAPVTRTGPSGDASWQCLARRGMLHSECESVDFIRLRGGSVLELRERVEEAVVVVNGSAVLELDEASPETLSARMVVLTGSASHGRITALTDTELLVTRTLPVEISRVLPPRVPELPR